MTGFLARLGYMLERTAASFGYGGPDPDQTQGCLHLHVDRTAAIQATARPTASIRITYEECS
jgi:hypothetical protein